MSDKKCNIKYEVIQDIVSNMGTPVQLYDIDIINRQCAKFIDSFKKQNFILGANFMQYFAVKATPNISILEYLLRKFNMGFDCSSLTELAIVDNIVYDGIKKIIYSSNYTSVEDLKILIKRNDLIINLDDLDGLYNLIEACEGKQVSDYIDTICFRYNPMFGETDSETKSNILGGENSKFGMSKNRILESYKLAKDNGIKNFGVHIMTGSCVMDPDYWIKLMEFCISLVDDIFKEHEIKIKFIDIGGGFGIPYKPYCNELDISKVAKNIRNTLKDLDIYIYTESGRYITGPSGFLISSCTSIKKDNGQIYYGLDANMANLMRPGMYGSYHHITVPRLEENDSTSITVGNVVGSLCENNDWFAKDRILPFGIVKKDIFIIHDTGAHGHSMGFQYNGKLRAPEYICSPSDNFDIKYIIRNRDKIEDILSKYKI